MDIRRSGVAKGGAVVVNWKHAGKEVVQWIHPAVDRTELGLARWLRPRRSGQPERRPGRPSQFHQSTASSLAARGESGPG